MIRIGNMNYCEYCFEPMAETSNFCTNCGSKYDPRRYPGTVPLGEVLAGKYIVGKVIGKGGFGITYLCFDTVNNKRVAIKEYFPDGFVYRDTGHKTVQIKQSPDVFKKGAKRFFEEAKLLYGFSNIPSIVKVEKFFAENNTNYYVMEYLVGMDLKEYFKNDPHPDENLVIYIAMEVLKSLKILHGKKVLHRDIAPDNIFMCNNGTVKLIDFGAARVTSLNEVSRSFSVILKPGFAPFEQYQRKGHQGPWTDIYALGATVYYLIKKKLPLDAASRQENDKLDMTGISPYLASVLAKMMAPRIVDRYKNADEVIFDLTEAQKHNINIPIVNDTPATHIPTVKQQTVHPDPTVENPPPDTVKLNKSDVQPIINTDNTKNKHDKNKKTKLAVILLCVAAALSYLMILAFIFYLLV